MSERLTFDPGASPLDVKSDGLNGIVPVKLEAPTPPIQPIWVGSIDTEGEMIGGRKYGNRTITVGLEVFEPDNVLRTTNLATYPSFETAAAVAAWIENDTDGSLTVSQSSDAAYSGDYSIKLVNTAAGAGDDDFVYLDLSGLASGTTHTISAYVYAPLFTAAAAGNRGLMAVNSIGTTATATLTAANNGWVRLQVQLTTGAGTTLQVRLYAPHGTTYWDAVQVEANATVSAYFDGDSPGAGWVGAAHASSSFTVAATGDGGYLRDAILADIHAKLAKLQQKGGVLRRTFNGRTRYYEILTVEGFDPAAFDQAFYVGTLAKIEFKLICRPLSYGTEQQLTFTTTHNGTVVIGTVDDVPGDVPALARLVINEPGAADRPGIYYGVRHKNYSADANQGLFWEAESADLGNAAVVADAGASGGSTARYSAAGSGWLNILDSILTNGTGFYTKLRGSYNVLVRAKASNATGRIRTYSYYYGGSGAVEGTPVTLNANYDVYDLGVVAFEDEQLAHNIIAIQGDQASGQTITLDYVLLVPADETSGYMQGPLPLSGRIILGHDSVYATQPDTIYGGPDLRRKVEGHRGDYFMLDPSADGSDPQQIVVKVVGSAPNTLNPGATVEVYATPRYLA